MTITQATTSPRTLTASQLDQLRAELDEQRAFRLAQLDELERSGAEPTEDLARSEVTAALRHGAQFALSEIGAALARLAAGRYGLCVNCDQPIAVARLEILPMAALCMPCQRGHEHRDRRAVP